MDDSPWEDDYQGSTDEYRATTSDQQEAIDICEIDDFEELLVWVRAVLAASNGFVVDFPRWCATDSPSRLLRRHDREDGKPLGLDRGPGRAGYRRRSAPRISSLRVGDEDAVDDMTLGAAAKWGEAQDDDFAMSARFGFDEITALGDGRRRAARTTTRATHAAGSASRVTDGGGGTGSSSSWR